MNRFRLQVAGCGAEECYHLERSPIDARSKGETPTESKMIAASNRPRDLGLS